MRRYTLVFALFLTLIAALPAQAADQLTILVLDSSRPMSERWEGETKWDRAAAYANTLARNLSLNNKIAAITFGSETCQPSLLLDSMDVGLAIATLESRLGSVVPGGDRALVAALESAHILAQESGMSSARIFVLTSGADQCREYMSELAPRYQASSVPVELQVFGLDMSADQSLDLTEQTGALGGSFRPFSGSTELQSTMKDTSRDDRGGLQVLVNIPPDEEQGLTTDARMEVYAQGNRSPLWGQSVNGPTFVNLPPGTYDVMVRWGGESRWQRSVTVSGINPAVVQFDFSQGVARVQITLADFIGTPLPGEIKIYNDETGVEVTTLDGDSSFGLSLAPGGYRIEARVGSVYVDEFIEVQEGDNSIIPIYIEADLGQALISVNNYDGIPVNGDIFVYDSTSGALIEQHVGVASVRANLAPGDYEVVVRVGDAEDSQSFSVGEGEEIELPFNMEVPLGQLFIELLDERGSSVFGTLRVYDTKGNPIEYYELEEFLDSEFSLTLPTGVYSIRVNSDGINKTVNNVRIGPDEETQLEIVFPTGGMGNDGFR